MRPKPYRTAHSRNRLPDSLTGFTLLELLVVIAISAILAALLFSGGKTALAKARKIKCVGNLKILGSAILQNASDLQGKWPAVYDGKTWYAILNESYDVPTNSFLCPSAKTPALTANWISYGYNITLGGGAVNTPPKYPMAVTRKHGELIVLADSIDSGSQQYYIVNGSPEPRLGSRHDGMANVFWGDGHITAQLKSDLTNAKYWNPVYVEP